MSIARFNHKATLLNIGKVLVAGGPTCAGCNTQTAELFDPATGTWSLTGTMTLFRSEHTARLLQNGKVLVAGGSGATAELYDPATGTWAPIGTMTTARHDHNATLLADGRVLVSGGIGTNFQALATAEIYSPDYGHLDGHRQHDHGTYLAFRGVAHRRHRAALAARTRTWSTRPRAPLPPRAPCRCSRTRPSQRRCSAAGRCWRLAASRRTPLGMPFRPPAPPSSRSVRR